MKHIKKFENNKFKIMSQSDYQKFKDSRKHLSAEDKFLFDWQKIDPETKAKLPYKEGDFVEVHVGYYGERPAGRPDDIHKNMQIISVRWYSKEDHDIDKVTYAVKDIGADDEDHFELGEIDIVRKLKDYEVEAEKYNL